MTKIKDKKMSKLGKAGANKKYAKRYEILLALSALVDKQYLNYLQSWPTTHLQKLLDAYIN